MWFKSRYVKSLEERLTKNETEISLLRQENARLVERLLIKQGVPLAQDREPIDPKTLDRLVSTAAIFEEVDENGHEIEELVDNRKGSPDAFPW